MKIYFCDNLAESQVEDSLNVIFVATFSFMIFYSFFYDLYDLYDFLDVLSVGMIFMIICYNPL